MEYRVSASGERESFPFLLFRCLRARVRNVSCCCSPAEEQRCTVDTATGRTLNAGRGRLLLDSGCQPETFRLPCVG